MSIRVPEELYRELERVAIGRGESVSQCTRRLIAEGLAPAEAATEIDAAIVALQRARDQLAG